MDKIIDGKDFKKLYSNKVFLILTNKNSLKDFNFDKINKYYYSKNENGLIFTDLDNLTFWYFNKDYEHYREVEILDNSKIIVYKNYYIADKFTLKEEKNILDIPLSNFCEISTKNLYFNDDKKEYYFIPTFISLILGNKNLKMVKFLNPNYPKFKELCMLAIEENPEILKYLYNKYPNFIDEEMCLKAFDKNHYIFIDAPYQSTKVCDLLVSKWPIIIKYFKPEFITLELCKKAFKINKDSFKYFRKLFNIEELKEMIFELIKEDKFLYLIKENQNQEICDYAYKINYKNLRYFSDEFKTKEMCEDVFKKDINMIQYVKDCYKTKEMCLEAIEKDIYLFKYTNYYDIDNCKKVLQIYPYFLNDINEEFLKKNPELYKIAYGDKIDKIFKYDIYKSDNKIYNIKDFYNWDTKIINLAILDITSNEKNFYKFS